MALPDPHAIIPRLVELCLEAAEPLEFTTYVVGVRAKRALSGIPNDEAHTWKGRIKCGVGQIIGDAWESLDRAPDFQRPQLRMIYDVDADRLEIELRSVYLYGRYTKLARGLPQTTARWKCRTCSGDGCETCEDTGLRYPVAVEDLLGRPCLEPFGAVSYQLHGMGREDIDVRCLGAGRPFVLELRTPTHRSIDLVALGHVIEEGADGRVGLPSGLRFVPEDTVARIKGWEAAKVYRVVCESTTDAAFDPAQVSALSDQLTGANLEQRTPVRVSRRRADKVRHRRVERFELGERSPRTFVAEVEAQSGTYIKELVSGDEGRTVPSVADLLGVPCVCTELDVLEIRVSDEELLST